MSYIPNEKIIHPQWKRKHKIILRARFSDDKKQLKDVKQVVARTLGEMWVFG